MKRWGIESSNVTTTGTEIIIGILRFFSNTESAAKNRSRVRLKNPGMNRSRWVDISRVHPENSFRIRGFQCIFFVNYQIRYLRDYLEFEKNKNMQTHQLVEIRSFPGSINPAESIWENFQNPTFGSILFKKNRTSGEIGGTSDPTTIYTFLQ